MVKTPTSKPALQPCWEHIQALLCWVNVHHRIENAWLHTAWTSLILVKGVHLKRHSLWALFFSFSLLCFSALLCLSLNYDWNRGEMKYLGVKGGGTILQNHNHLERRKCWAERRAFTWAKKFTVLKFLSVLPGDPFSKAKFSDSFGDKIPLLFEVGQSDFLVWSCSTSAFCTSWPFALIYYSTPYGCEDCNSSFGTYSRF